MTSLDGMVVLEFRSSGEWELVDYTPRDYDYSLHPNECAQRPSHSFCSTCGHHTVHVSDLEKFTRSASAASAHPVAQIRSHFSEPTCLNRQANCGTSGAWSKEHRRQQCVVRCSSPQNSDPYNYGDICWSRWTSSSELPASLEKYFRIARAVFVWEERRTELELDFDNTDPVVQHRKDELTRAIANAQQTLQEQRELCLAEGMDPEDFRYCG